MASAAGSWQSRAPQLGDVALGLLAPEWTAGILSALASGPLRPAELRQVIPAMPHATMMDRVRELHAEGLVVRERLARDPRGTAYALTEHGRALEQIVATAAVIEGRRRDAPRGRPPGEAAVRLAADPYGRAIRRLLAVRPLTLSEIERRLPGLAHSSIMRELRELESAGMIETDRRATARVREIAQRSAARLHALTLDGRRLVPIVLLAARWERRTGEQRPMPSDINGIVHTIAPLAHVPSHLEGVCRLCIDGDSREPDLNVSLAKGRISALELPPSVIFDAHGSADASAWTEALLQCEPAGIAVEGDRVLLGTAVCALGAALRA